MWLFNPVFERNFFTQKERELRSTTQFLQVSKTISPYFVERCLGGKKTLSYSRLELHNGLKSVPCSSLLK